jgi:hypothetical protein
MDPVSLVAGALAAGASQGLAESAIGDLYRRLKRRLAGRAPADADPVRALGKWRARRETR